MRVLIHAGFHKTGTTTMQKTLRANRARLKPHLRIVLRPGMTALCEAARAWSVSRSQMDLGLLRFEAAALAEGWRAGDPRPVLLSSEDLCGHMPGRRGLLTYDAAPQLLHGIAEAIATVHSDAEIGVFLTTRAPGPWLASCHAQHLRAMRMTLDADTYAQDYRASADLAGMAGKIAKAVDPHPVHSAALEDWADHPLGPLAPLLNCAGLPATVRDALDPLPALNTAPDPTQKAQLLALNRSDLDDAALKAAKKALYREWS